MHVRQKWLHIRYFPIYGRKCFIRICQWTDYETPVNRFPQLLSAFATLRRTLEVQAERRKWTEENIWRRFNLTPTLRFGRRLVRDFDGLQATHWFWLGEEPAVPLTDVSCRGTSNAIGLAGSNSRRRRCLGQIIRNGEGFVSSTSRRVVRSLNDFRRRPNGQNFARSGHRKAANPRGSNLAGKQCLSQ